MIEWVLIIDMHYTSQKIEVHNKDVCLKTMTNLRDLQNKSGYEYVVTSSYCVNQMTGEVVTVSKSEE